MENVYKFLKTFIPNITPISPPIFHSIQANTPRNPRTSLDKNRPNPTITHCHLKIFTPPEAKSMLCVKYIITVTHKAIKTP